jgi:hypothetical protein
MEDDDWINCDWTAFHEQIFEYRSNDIWCDESREVHHFLVFAALSIASLEIGDSAAHPTHGKQRKKLYLELRIALDGLDAEVVTLQLGFHELIAERRE